LQVRLSLAISLAKTVEVNTIRNTVYHVTRKAAFSLFKSGKAIYLNENRDSMMEVRPFHPNFSDAWKMKPSGGITVWQYESV
jgi:hypothetical protein